MKRQFAVICASYASVPVTRVPKVKVGVVGEIYVKYSPLATTIWKNSWKAKTAK